jgi:hypothetical protein
VSDATIREYLRRHVLGLLAIFIALSGTAIAAGDGPSASTSAVTTAKFKKLKHRVSALESALNSPVKGDLTGTFPNLHIATDSVGGRALKPLYVSLGTSGSIGAGSSSGTVSAFCDGTDQILSGGAFWSAVPDNALIEETTIATNSEQWVGKGRNNTASAQVFNTRAWCLPN